MGSVFAKVKDYLQPRLTKLFWNVNNHFDRKGLLNHDFTVLCPNFVGGAIYSRLGCKFMSPTINMWMEDRDLIKFAADLDAYIHEELAFITSKYDYPVAKLGDIILYFNHCKTEEEAAAHWHKRLDRINRDNLFVIVSDRCGLTQEQLERFRSIPCKGKVMFTADKNCALDFMLYLPYYANDEKVGIYMLDRRKNYLGVAPFDGYFDYTHFVNTGEVRCTLSLRNRLLRFLGRRRDVC